MIFIEYLLIGIESSRLWGQYQITDIVFICGLGSENWWDGGIGGWSLFVASWDCFVACGSAMGVAALVFWVDGVV